MRAELVVSPDERCQAAGERTPRERRQRNPDRRQREDVESDVMAEQWIRLVEAATAIGKQIVQVAAGEHPTREYAEPEADMQGCSAPLEPYGVQAHGDHRRQRKGHRPDHKEEELRAKVSPEDARFVQAVEEPEINDDGRQRPQYE